MENQSVCNKWHMVIPSDNCQDKQKKLNDYKMQTSSLCDQAVHMLLSSNRVCSNIWFISRFSSLACESFSVRTSSKKRININAKHVRLNMQWVSSDSKLNICW